MVLGTDPVLKRVIRERVNAEHGTADKRGAKHKHGSRTLIKKEIQVSQEMSGSTHPKLRPTICHVLHTLHVGGGEVLARSFAMNNVQEFRPVFALLDELGELGRELREQGWVVQVIGRRPGFDLRCVSKLRELFHREKVTLIHAHQYGPLFYSAAARLPWRVPPILFTEHGRDHPDYRRWKRVFANRVLLSQRDRFVAVGNSVRKAIVDFEGISERRVEVIYNGRDLSEYNHQTALRREIRTSLGLASDVFGIITVARLDRLKDYPTALRAMSRVLIEHPKAKLILVGDGEDRSQLERLVQQLRLQQVVDFLGSRNDVPRLLQAADAFLLSSISEGIPLTLIEAMATKLPCVATRVGGVSEVVAEGETGLLADAGDDAGLAKHLCTLARDSQLRIEMGEAGRDRVLARFNAEAMHSSYRALYRHMTNTGCTGCDTADAYDN